MGQAVFPSTWAMSSPAAEAKAEERGIMICIMSSHWKKLHQHACQYAAQRQTNRILHVRIREMDGVIAIRVHNKAVLCIHETWGPYQYRTKQTLALTYALCSRILARLDACYV